jgi:ribonucleotide reductase beta subunit family protein with ferritin-like domain
VAQFWTATLESVRILSYIVMVIGILMLVRFGYDEFRGITSAPSMTVMRRYSYYPHDILNKKDKPEEFRNAMKYHWIMSSMIVIAGFILFAIDRKQEALDPMSADSDENIDDELRHDELDEQMRKEKEQHKHPEL